MAMPPPFVLTAASLSVTCTLAVQWEMSHQQQQCSCKVPLCTRNGAAVPSWPVVGWWVMEVQEHFLSWQVSTGSEAAFVTPGPAVVRSNHAPERWRDAVPWGYSVLWSGEMLWDTDIHPTAWCALPPWEKLTPRSSVIAWVVLDQALPIPTATLLQCLRAKNFSCSTFRQKHQDPLAFPERLARSYQCVSSDSP